MTLLGAIGGFLGRPCEPLASLSEFPGGFVEPLGRLFGSSWGSSGSPGSLWLEMSRALGSSLGASWGLLGASWAVLEGSWPV